MDLDDRRPKSFGRTWGVTIGIAVFLVAALVATVFIVQQPLGRPIATPGPSAIADTGETEFTANGIAYASSHRFVTVNLTSLPIPAAKLGLGDDARATIPANQFGNSLRIIDGTKNVTLTDIGAITVSSSGSTLSRLVFSVSALTVSDVHKRLLEDVDDLGIDAATLPPLDSAIASAGHDGRGYSTTLPTTARVGAPLSTRIDCVAGGSCSVTYAADLQP